jgi:hypothetical protein
MLPLAVCLADNLIIDVCDVHTQSDVVAEEVSQDSLYNVETNICPKCYLSFKSFFAYLA